MGSYFKKVFDPAVGIVPPWERIDGTAARITVVTVNGVKYWRVESRKGDAGSTGNRRTEMLYHDPGMNVSAANPSWAVGWSHYFDPANKVTPDQWGLIFQPLHYTENPPQVGGPLVGLAMEKGRINLTVRADPDGPTNEPAKGKSGTPHDLMAVPWGHRVYFGCQVKWGSLLTLAVGVDAAPMPELSIPLKAPAAALSNGKPGAYGPQTGVYMDSDTPGTVVNHIGKVVRGTTLADVTEAWSAAAPPPPPTGITAAQVWEELRVSTPMNAYFRDNLVEAPKVKAFFLGTGPEPPEPLSHFARAFVLETKRAAQ